MKLETLRDLFIEQLSDLYDAENQLVEALPQMATAASSRDLQNAFRDHLDKTKQHVVRLDAIFEHLGVSGKGKKCKAMQGLIAEGEEAIKAQGSDSVRDAALIAAAQRVEHYEIAGYGTVRTYAQALGSDTLSSLLQRTLDEEGDADKLLTSLAEGQVNVQASQA
jgi:ferritin-like metal-binding protein YciE